MKTNQIKLLINLALIDGAITSTEKAYIDNIAKANGISLSTVSQLISESPHNNEDITKNITQEERRKALTSLIELMKVDARLYVHEIRYCISIAQKLGYDRHFVADMLTRSTYPEDRTLAG